MRRQLMYLFVLLLVLFAVSLPIAAADFAGIEEDILTKQIPLIEKSIAALEEYLAENPEDGQALWLTAKAYLYLGDEVDDGKLEVFETGQKYADRAVEHLPDSPHSHYWQSALIGRVGQTRGILSSLFMVRPMKDALDRVLELDQDYADAYWVLSQLYHQAPGFPLSIGNKKLALENANKALELDAENLEYILQLALVLEYNGRKEEAKQVVTDLLKKPEIENEPKVKADAEEFLAKLDK